MRNYWHRYFFSPLGILLVTSSVLLFAQSSTPAGKLSLADLQKQAAAGDPAAQNELGLRYRLGTDVDKDPAKAIPWFLKAARQGYAKAYFNLGAAYYNGDGVNVNDQDSCVWFMLAADAGDQRGEEAVARTRQSLTPPEMTHCEVLTATAYLTGDMVKQDYAKAMQWYQHAANAGDGLACERVAYFYDRGLGGVAQDKQQSFDWLKRSADLGYVPAIYELGMMYETGGVVHQDMSEAVKLYGQAAANGQPEAFVALGNLYAEGRGVKQDRQKALMYYILGGTYGSPEGKHRADEISAQMTPKQVASAKEEAAKYASAARHPLLLVRKQP